MTCKQVAEEQARSRKLAEKLAAARSASSSAPAHAQLASADEAKRRAEQHAENMRQVRRGRYRTPVADAFFDRLMYMLLLCDHASSLISSVVIEVGNYRAGAVQKLLLLRKDTAAREAQLREEAAAARGEAEAAAQLVHALQPKGDFVLGTLWTKVSYKPKSLGCSFHAVC